MPLQSSTVKYKQYTPVSGITFIEIIVSLFLLSLMLLGLEAMYFIALREAKSNNYYNIAIQQLTNITEYLKNKPSQDISTWVQQWNQENQRLLPHGHGIVSGYSANRMLAIYWGRAREETCIHDRIGLSGCLHLTIKDKADLLY